MARGERHIEMTWQCAVCSTRCLGRYKQCQGCGKPKEAEEYEMPADTESAATVTDAALLRMATAGADWRCAYCGTDQRASDGSCGQCGASAVPAVAEPEPVFDAAISPRIGWVKWAIGGGAFALLALIGGLWFAVWNRNRPHDYDATVAAVAWTRSIDVAHYALHDHEGFQESIPPDATHITSLGQQVHHQEQVLDHMETEHYTEEVSDGYRSESYTERVACGQDCTSTPQSCHEVCSSKKNGFASCRQVCSGGGQSCSTKYCSESRTRQVPKTRTVDRTREVPRYRSEPRYAEAFHYQAWDWTPDRTEKAVGSDATDVHWPDNGARAAGLPEGEREREERHESYVVTLSYDGRTVRFAVPSAEALAPFAVHSAHHVRRVQERLYLDDQPLTPL